MVQVEGFNGIQLVKIPDKVTGYQLDPEKSFWSAVVPEGTTNLLTNPSHEVDDGGGSPVGYTLNGTWIVEGTNASKGIKSSRGGYSSGDSIAQSVNLTQTGPYTFSLDLYGYAGRVYELRVVKSAQTIGTKVIRPTYNGWGRYHVSFAANSTGSYSVGLYVTTGEGPGSAPNWTDAWQLEAKSYPTTYVDGDLPNDNLRVARTHFWNGTPHLSTSTRNNQTYTGGRVVSFTDTGFMTTGIVGLGLPSPNIVETTRGVSGTRQFAGQTTMPREFAITGVFTGCDFGTLLRQRQTLIDILNPYKTSLEGPITLIFQLVDLRGNVVGPPLKIRALYIDGLQGTLDSFNQEELTIRFRMYDPFPQSMFDKGLYLGTPVLTQANTGIAYRYPDGTWTTLEDELDNSGEPANVGDEDGNPGTVGHVNVVKFDDKTGYFYVAGNFNRKTLDGDIQFAGSYVANNLLRWKPGGEIEGLYNSAWGGEIYDIAFGTGYLEGWYIIGGEFTSSTGSGYNAENIFFWKPGGNPGGYLAGGYEPDNGLNGPVYAVEVLPDGRVVVGGKFTDDGNDTGTNLNGVAIITPDGAGLEDWQSMNGGLNIDGVADRQVNDIAISPSGDIYVAGTFTQNNAGTVDLKSIAKWNAELTQWEPVGTGLSGEVNKITFGPDGALYAVGGFNQDGSGNISLNYHARFNGQSWENIGTQAFYNWSLEYLQNGQNFIGGGYVLGAIWPNIGSEIARVIGNVTLPSDLAIYGDNGWLGGSYIAPHTIDSSSSGGLVLGFTRAETTYTIATNNIFEVDYEGTAPVRPTIVITGPGTPRVIENLTTGAAIYFSDDLMLGETEQMTIDLSKSALQVFSTERLNMSAFLLPSDFSRFFLVPGVNRLSFFVEDHVGGINNAEAYIKYTPQYTGIEYVGNFA